MSNLLKEAIVDAQALREAALKNAESSIIEKYSQEVKTTLNKLLEQEEDPAAEDPAADLLGGGDAAAADPLAGGAMGAPDAGLGADAGTVEEVAVDVPLGAADGEKLCACPDEGQVTEVSVDLDELREAVDALRTEVSDSEEINLDEEILEALLAEEDDEDAEPKDWQITGGESEGEDVGPGGSLAGGVPSQWG